jgi:colanic acid biosynthesis glycosyl transferase WcaI
LFFVFFAVFVVDPMHVCFFNRSSWPDLSATGQLLTELAEDLVRMHGWDVTVVTGYPLRSDARLPASEWRHGVHIVRAAGSTLDPSRFTGRAVNYVTYFASAVLKGQGVRRPEVVVALTDPPIIGLAALAAAARARAPFVFLCEDIFPEVAVLLEDFQSPLVNDALTQVNRFLVRKAARIIALGDTMKRRLVEGKGADPSKVTVIHNWTDCGAVMPGPRDNAFARQHDLVDRFVVLHAGNIGLSQNLEIILHAAEQLRDRPDIMFVLVGEGSKKRDLQDAAVRRDLRNVLFLPFQPRETMNQSYATADVSLISLKRGLAGVIVPSKLYSVLASGRPCIAAVEKDCEVAQIVREAGCGFVVNPGDASALRARVVDIASDSSQAREMGDRAREAALPFDRPRQVAAYDALLREVAAAC